MTDDLAPIPPEPNDNDEPPSLVYIAETMLQFTVDTGVKAYEAGTGRKIRRVIYEHGRIQIDYAPITSRTFIPD